MKLGDIIIIILFILAMSIGAWYLFGNSPTLEQTILAFLLMSVFTRVITVNRNSIKIDYMEKNFRESFNNMKSDLKDIKQKLEKE